MTLIVQLMRILIALCLHWNGFERAFSSFSLVHTKLRNCLGNTRVMKLVRTPRPPKQRWWCWQWPLLQNSDEVENKSLRWLSNMSVQSYMFLFPMYLNYLHLHYNPRSTKLKYCIKLHHCHFRIYIFLAAKLKHFIIQ